MKIIIKYVCFVYLLFVIILITRADTNCYPRWLPGSKSRIRVTYVPLENSMSIWERRLPLNFLSMSITFPKDMKEILACDINSRAKIEVRYKEKHSTSREMKSRLLPNSLKQNIIIRQLKPCTDYSLRIRLATPEKDKIYLKLDDFRTGPSNKIPSLDVRNITDKSAVVTWNPKENGIQCATSFRIKGGVHSFDVNPDKVLTTWKSLESCRQYIINIFPKLGEKVGQSTSIKFTTFPSPKFFDAWVDESKNLIVWQPNERWKLCTESVTSIQHTFKVIKCSLDKPQFTHIISLDQSCTASLECSINIDELKKQITDKLDIEEGSYYDVNLNVILQNRKDKTITLNLLPNLVFQVNGNNKFTLNVIGQFNQECQYKTQDNSNPTPKTAQSGPSHDAIEDHFSYDEDYVDHKESQNPTMVAVACTSSILITIVILVIYVYKNQVQTNVNRVSNQVNRLSNNMAPHYAQYFRGPIQERISIVDYQT